MSNLIYRAQETAIQFSDNDGDYAINLSGLASGLGRISNRVDRGTGSKPMRYKWRAIFQFATTPVVLDHVDVVLCESDGTYADANMPTTDSSMTWGQFSNLQVVGDVRVQSAAANTSFVASGTCWIAERYFQIGVFNHTTVSLRNLNNINRILLIPMPDEIQD